MVSASMDTLGRELPVPLMFTDAVNEPPGPSDASPKQSANGNWVAPVRKDESRHTGRPSEVVMLESVTEDCSLKKAAMYWPVHAFGPLLMVVDAHLPDAQVMESSRLQGWAATSGRARRVEAIRMSAARKDGPPRTWNVECRIAMAPIIQHSPFNIQHSAFSVTLAPLVQSASLRRHRPGARALANRRGDASPLADPRPARGGARDR